MTRKTPTTEAPANPLPTLTPEALQALIEEVSASRKLMAEQMAEIAELNAAKPQAANGQSTKSAENEWKTIKAFAKAGFGKVKPHEDVKTFNLWIAAGMRPKEGSKAVKVNNLRLFCKAQVRPLTPEEKQAMQAKADEVVNANKAKIDAAVGRPRKGKVIPLNDGEASPQ